MTAPAPPQWVRDDFWATKGWEAAQYWRQFGPEAMTERADEIAGGPDIVSPYHRGLLAGLRAAAAELAAEEAR